MNLVPQSLNELQDFERGESPLRTLDIGHLSQISKITSEDLELLALYTNGHDDKSDISGGEDFPEIFGHNVSEWKPQLERAQEIFDLLKPYYYHFGDNFYGYIGDIEDDPDWEKHMWEYIDNILKNPKYNYVYDCMPFDDPEWHTFFSEIELPSAIKIPKSI